MNGEQLRGHLDLLPSVLAAGPVGGYAIIAALRAHGEEASDLPDGTVHSTRSCWRPWAGRPGERAR